MVDDAPLPGRSPIKPGQAFPAAKKFSGGPPAPPSLHQIMRARAVQNYAQHSVQTASREQLLLALYDKAIRDTREAAELIRRQDIPAKAKRIQSASNIVGELAATLDFLVAPELCETLARIYSYLQFRLTYAHLHMDATAAEEAVELLSHLRETWRQAAEQIAAEAKAKQPSSGDTGSLKRDA